MVIVVWGYHEASTESEYANKTEQSCVARPASQWEEGGGSLHNTALHLNITT